MSRRSSVSMKDVAALAKVSVGTVSNVINTPALVAPATREKVLVAITKLGWVPNESARQLRAGKSQSIGMLVLDITNPFFADLVRGAEDFFYDNGYTVHIGNSDQRPERETQLLTRFERERVDGILLAPIGAAPPELERIRQRGTQVVLLDRAGGAPGFCSVGVDDIEGGRLAGLHLLSCGHRRIGFVGGPSTLPQIVDRRRGLELAIEQIAPDSVLLALSTPTLDVASGLRAAQELALLPDSDRPTAIFAANDLVAIGMLQGFVQAGARVPEDVAIIGYDDISFAAAAAVPLSSIRQPRYRLAARAAHLLFAEVKAANDGIPHAHQNLRSSPELVVRQSTAQIVI